jgi:hypothetical protein
MNFLNKSAELEHPIAGGDVIQIPISSAADPYQALDDLMAAVEALCPTWPPREPFLSTDRMLL